MTPTPRQIGRTLKRLRAARGLSRYALGEAGQHQPRLRGQAGSGRVGPHGRNAAASGEGAGRAGDGAVGVTRRALRLVRGEPVFLTHKREGELRKEVFPNDIGARISSAIHGRREAVLFEHGLHASLERLCDADPAAFNREWVRFDLLGMTPVQTFGTSSSTTVASTDAGASLMCGTTSHARSPI